MGQMPHSSIPRLIAELERVAKDPAFLILFEVDDDGQLWFVPGSEDYESVATEEQRQFGDLLIGDLNEWLITDTGHHDYPSRQTLERLGYKFLPGESDSFGPLTSVIAVPRDGRWIHILYG